MSKMSDKLSQAEMSCFVRCVGVSSDYSEEILELDRQYYGRGYIRIDRLDLPTDRDELESLKLQALDFKNSFDGARVLALYHESVASVNDSIETNLIVSLLYRSKLLSEIAGILVCGGKIGYKEYLFCYLAYLRGWKVLMLMPEGEGKLSEVLTEKSERLEIGAPYPAQIPPFSPPVMRAPEPPAPPEPPVQRPPQRSPETGNIRMTIPPRERTRREVYSSSEIPPAEIPPAPPRGPDERRDPYGYNIMAERRTPPPPQRPNIKVKIPPRPPKRGARSSNSGNNWFPVRRDDRRSPDNYGAPPTRTPPMQPPPPRRPMPARQSTPLRELSYEELARRAGSVVMISICNRYGDMMRTVSGIAVGPDGFILTNCHLIDNGVYFQVRRENDPRIYPAQVIKYNSVHDMAVLRIPATVKPLPLCSGSLARGQKVVAIGSPVGLYNTVSDGIISGFRNINGLEMIQFTAPIAAGSTGGAVLNTYGELIGMYYGGNLNNPTLTLAASYRSLEPFIMGFFSYNQPPYR